jgi:hypothetical protein
MAFRRHGDWGEILDRIVREVLKGIRMVLSQTRFVLAYTGELTLAGGWRISDLAPSW